MKAFNTCLLLFVLLSVHALSQPLKPGDKVPPITITNLLNATQASVDLQSLKGKVVMLDFWATWCVPCVKSFPKLDEMQKKFGKDLQIISISDEPAERISRFIKNRPVNLWFASDTSPVSTLKQRFPRIALPHVVLIDAKGVVQAITRGDEVNADVVAQVIKGITPAVSFKNEVVADGKVFEEVKPGEEYFGIKGYQPGIRASKSVMQNSITYVNTYYPHIFLDVYNMSSVRLRYENIDASEKKLGDESKYCVYLATKGNNYKQMIETLKERLNKELVYKSKTRKEKDTVFVITRIGAPDTSIVKPANTAKRTNNSKSSLYTRSQPVGEAVAKYLEAFGILPGVVLDETGDKDLNDISVSWEPEKETGVAELFKRLGLKAEKAVREYDVLVIYK